jgi:hypothetical protein
MTDHAFHRCGPLGITALVAGCAGARPPTVEIAVPLPTIASAITPEPVPEPAPVEVAAVAAPAGVILDGDLREWPQGAPAGIDGGSAPKPPGQVYVALAADGAIVAADLDKAAAARGVWVGIGSEPRRGPGPSGSVCTAPAPTPAEDEVCEANAHAFTAFVTKYHRSFERLYRIDRDGIRVAEEGGALAVVPQARAAWKATARGATAEAWIPAAALPRMDQAPIRALRLVARVTPAPSVPAFDAKEWRDVRIEPPVGIGPQAELRAAVFGALAERQCDDVISYQPGDPERLIGAWSGPAPLYVKQASLGEVEVGFALTNPATCVMAGANGPATEETVVAVRHRGKPTRALRLGRVMRIATRAGELHVISFRSGYSDGEGWWYADWSVTAVTGDGSLREDLVQPPTKHAVSAPEGTRWSWSDPFHATDFASFGVHGSAQVTDPKTGAERLVRTETTWRWDPKAKAYVGREKLLATP